jgi:GNAT superfamily N-acetyltransferase
MAIEIRPIDTERDLYGIYYDSYGELEFAYEDDEVVLERLFVNKEYRGTGVARALLNYLEDHMRKKNLVNIISPGIINRDIVLAFEKLGFIGCEEDDIIGIDELRQGIPKEDNTKQYQGLIMMCKNIK